MAKHIRALGVRELLKDDAGYLIPMYQRNYAWEKPEIEQLIQDVMDCQQRFADGSGTQHYYIGTLVVQQRRSDGRFEVIDGQQRFTTLLLVALCLKNLGEKAGYSMSWLERVNLEYESRPMSSKTLSEIGDGRTVGELETNEFNSGIVRGYTIIHKKLELMEQEKLAGFARYLFDNVQIMRVMVPDDTDLNHYFEIMNSRGEQLEKHEVLKAEMLALLNRIKSTERRCASIQALHQVWDACANMERYVQYGFGVEQRNKLFGHNDWGRFKPEDFDDLLDKLEQSGGEEYNTEGDSLTLHKILATPPLTDEGGKAAEDSPDRFNSVINFPNFLLHVLRVMTREDVTLDDKKLLDEFNVYLFHETNITRQIERVQEFIYALLRCKFMFDQYVIKRDFTEGAEDGRWSLKRLKYYASKSASYINSFNDGKGGYDGINRQILMLLSAFHVSIPSMVYKHWLSAVLYYLYWEGAVNPKNYLQHLERTARRFVFDNYLAGDDARSYYEMIFNEEDEGGPVEHEVDRDRLSYRNIQSNFVFNYLDYLLWKRHRGDGKIYSEFEFTFRSSVEHFFPQNPKGAFDPLPERVLHDFGNLCLISHSKNSRMGNDSPKGKLDYFRESKKKNQIDSLKLLHMIDTADGDNWRESQIIKHSDDMFELLMDAL